MIGTHAALDRWLESATRGLCAEAKLRVAEEVTEHFEEAVAAWIEDGLSENDSAVKTMRELGSPRRERRRLRREHLTAREEISLLALMRTREGRSVNVLGVLALSGAFMSLCAVAVLAIAVHTGNGREYLTSTPCLFLVGFNRLGQFGLEYWIRPLFNSRGFVPAWRTVQFLGVEQVFEAWSALFLLGFLSQIQMLSDSSAYWIIELCLGLGAATALAVALFRFRFAGKLQRLGYDAPPTAKA